MPEETVIDTSVLQKANAKITKPPKEKRLFAKRVRLLDEIQRGLRIVLISRALLAEYERKLPSPRNDYIKAFFELLADPQRRTENYSKWPGHLRKKARGCRYPVEDDHVLRTAIRPAPTTIVTEENRMLRADECIYRKFRVHIRTI